MSVIGGAGSLILIVRRQKSPDAMRVLIDAIEFRANGARTRQPRAERSAALGLRVPDTGRRAESAKLGPVSRFQRSKRLLGDRVFEGVAAGLMSGELWCGESRPTQEMKIHRRTKRCRQGLEGAAVPIDRLGPALPDLFRSPHMRSVV
jgi:hypothetical protein